MLFARTISGQALLDVRFQHVSRRLARQRPCFRVQERFHLSRGLSVLEGRALRCGGMPSACPDMPRERDARRAQYRCRRAEVTLFISGVTMALGPNTGCSTFLHLSIRTSVRPLICCLVCQ
jgi:hypothetical protein